MKIHTETLFAYSSLQQPYIQETVFQEILPVQPDWVEGYKKGTIMIHNLEHVCAEKSAEERIEGGVLHLTPIQLNAADHYETRAYRRVRVRTVGGVEAWMYVAAE